MNHSSFTITDVTKDFIFLVDNDVGKSVTNDAEYVVEIANTRFPGRRILYRDTTGEWDELKHDNGIFTGFAPIPAKDRVEVMSYLK